MNKASVLSALPFFFQLLSVSQATVFQPSSLKAFFVEQFTSSSFGTWSPSEAVKEGYGAERETMQYNGKWSVEEASTYPGLEGDLGLVVKTTAAHHAISIPFKTLLEPEKEFASGKKEGLVVQYEVKLQNGLDCGGAYIKLLSDDEKGIQAQEFSDKTPYTIMFGPDKCGGTQKVHLIIRHENPLTGEYEEKHLKNPPNPRTDKLTHLYTLIIKPDQTYEIKIDNESAKSGSLLEDFEPPFNPPKEINDPEDKKPEDWVDAARIPDPEATKPDDWDEDAPREIPDVDAVKPDSWLEEEPTTIPDPESEKPDEWDDEEDGDWIAPSIPNPKCEDVAGCGPWNRPVKPNPDYKGPWTAPYIDNPDYIGIWTPRKIPNPNYYEDLTPADLNPMAGIGIELWTMSNDILFDNFLVSFNPEDAEIFAKETYLLKLPLEEAKEEADKPKVEESETVGGDKTFAEDPVGFAKTKLRTFIDVAVVDPVYAFKSMPETGSVLVASVIGLIGVLGVLMNVLNPAPAKKVVEPAKKVVKKEAEPAKKDGADVKPEAKEPEAAAGGKKKKAKADE